MKIFKACAIFLFLIVLTLPVQADEHIGPAFHWSAGTCAVYVPDVWRYEGTPRIVWSNGRTGHATYKCKLHLVEGDPQIYFSEWSQEGFPIADAGPCLNRIDIEGQKGMWTGQCFGTWNDGD